MKRWTEESAAIGQFLVQAVANWCGCEPIVEQIERSVYKGTDCGAWIKFTETGIAAGSIVEGSDAEVHATPLVWADQTEEEIHAWLDETFEHIEAEAAALWHEANDEEDD